MLVQIVKVDGKVRVVKFDENAPKGTVADIAELRLRDGESLGERAWVAIEVFGRKAGEPIKIADNSIHCNVAAVAKGKTTFIRLANENFTEYK